MRFAVPVAATSRGWQIWASPAFYQPATFDGNIFEFLGEQAELKNDWNNPKFSKLWLYNLHYLDNLNSVSFSEQIQINKYLVERWAEQNPVMVGNGWEPYVISLRVVNIIKWLAREPEIDSTLLISLVSQGMALEKQVEYHILGNHLFTNGKALVFLGSYLAGDEADRWLKKGLSILDAEIKEQFLSDGGHFERSPMYHAILLWDMCDLVYLARQSGLPELEAKKEEWEKVIQSGFDWLHSMIHPDGGIAFFNDSAFGIAPTFENIRQYIRFLDISINEGSIASSDEWQSRNFSDSGYVSISRRKISAHLFLDVGVVGPYYQPGHAHADTLSFEFSIFGNRVFVNSGTSMYGNNNERHRQRSTAAHNTVLVNDENSSEVWAGFRVGRRAEVKNLIINEKSNCAKFSAEHTGYLRLKSSVLHARSWQLKDNCLTIKDELKGSFNTAQARFHLHPSIVVENTNPNEFVLILQNDKTIVCVFEGAVSISVVPTTWHPKFGSSIENNCLVANFGSSTVVSKFTWSNS